MHLEELIRTEVVPREGELVFKDRPGGKGYERVPVDEWAGYGRRRRVRFYVETGVYIGFRRGFAKGQILVGIFVIFVVPVIETVEGGLGADGGREGDGGH